MLRRSCCSLAFNLGQPLIDDVKLDQYFARFDRGVRLFTGFTMHRIDLCLP